MLSVETLVSEFWRMAAGLGGNDGGVFDGTEIGSLSSFVNEGLEMAPNTSLVIGEGRLFSFCSEFRRMAAGLGGRVGVGLV